MMNHVIQSWWQQRDKVTMKCWIFDACSRIIVITDEIEHEKNIFSHPSLIIAFLDKKIMLKSTEIRKLGFKILCRVPIKVNSK